MTYNLIKFRGKREGISIYIRDGDFEDIVTELERKIKKSEQFLTNACLSSKSDQLTIYLLKKWRIIK